jgi:hypothetical protein
MSTLFPKNQLDRLLGAGRRKSLTAPGIAVNLQGAVVLVERPRVEVQTRKRIRTKKDSGETR